MLVAALPSPGSKQARSDLMRRKLPAQSLATHPESRLPTVVRAAPRDCGRPNGRCKPKQTQTQKVSARIR